MLIDPPILICKPQPAGSASPEEFYEYSGSMASMRRVATSDVPRYEVVDDAPQPNVYRLPFQNGWLLDFKRLFGERRQWVVFVKDRRLYLDTGRGTWCVSDRQVTVRVRRHGCLVHVRVLLTGSSGVESFWVYIPLSRLLTWDPVVPVEQCEPLCDLFMELSSPEGMAVWIERWATGRAFRSTALKVPESVVSPTMAQ